MRHALPEDLDRLEPLLGQLRSLPQLRERKRGSFSRGSRAFLHFHADGDDLYVDVKLDGDFRRLKVTGEGDRTRFLTLVRQALVPA